MPEKSSEKEVFPPKFRVDTILSEMPHEERIKKSRKLKAPQSMRNVLSRMRKTNWGDTYSPGGDTLREIATILEVPINELYTPVPDEIFDQLY